MVIKSGPRAKVEENKCLHGYEILFIFKCMFEQIK